MGTVQRHLLVSIEKSQLLRLPAARENAPAREKHLPSALPRDLSRA
jgi:hypothetical protein